MKVLFEPLGIRRVAWGYSRFDSLPHMGGGLGLRSQDMARIGYLILRHGRWAGRQVIPDAWVSRSTSRVVKGAGIFTSQNPDYGYLWWLFTLPTTDGSQAGGGDIIAAMGAGGQTILVIPSLDAVVVTTAQWPNPQRLPILDILFRDVLPAIGR